MRPVSVLSALLASALPLLSQNPSNGAFGGYLGSDRWFSQMRQQAANQALIRSLGGSAARNRPLPPDYVEFAGLLEFPGGNPFPKGRLPDLRIRCSEPARDGVERAPHVDEAGAFYTVLKRGCTYEVCWMYYFGSKEAFARVVVPAQGPATLQQRIPYQAQESAKPAAPKPEPRATPRSGLPAMDPAEADRYDLTGFPAQPTTFDEQAIQEAIRGANDPALKAIAHGKLARWHEARGDRSRAERESAKAAYWRNR